MGVAVNIDCQLDRIKNHLLMELLDKPMKVSFEHAYEGFIDYFNWGGKIPLDSSWCHFMDWSPILNKKNKKSKLRAYISASGGQTELQGSTATTPFSGILSQQ